MALINCPECKKEISDKVKACPFCGFPFESTEDSKKEVQQVEISSVNLKPIEAGKRKKIIIGISIAVVVIGMGLLVTYFLGVKKYNSYIDYVNSAMESMLDGGSDAESLLNLTANVWRNTIYEKSDPSTDKYTKGNYGFHDDFNLSLAVLFDASSTKATISSMKANQSVVESIMKNVQEPPKGLENCYETLTELYATYKGITGLAINPSGSLTTFSENKSGKIDKFLELYDKLETQLPEKK